MKSFATLSLLAALASAAAVDMSPKPRTAMLKRQANVCPGIQSPLCCALDVAGVADLTCSSPGDVSSLEELDEACAAKGLSAECCTLSVAGEALLCTAS